MSSQPIAQASFEQSKNVMSFLCAVFELKGKGPSWTQCVPWFHATLYQNMLLTPSRLQVWIWTTLHLVMAWPQRLVYTRYSRKHVNRYTISRSPSLYPLHQLIPNEANQLYLYVHRYIVKDRTPWAIWTRMDEGYSRACDKLKNRTVSSSIVATSRALQYWCH